MSLKTFRDPLLSRWQSAVEEVLHRKEGTGTGGAAARPTLDHPVVAAATTAAAHTLSGISTAPAAVAGTAAAPPRCTDDECAHLALQLAKAKAEHRPEAEIQQLQDALRFSTCDPLWAEAVTEYVHYFDVDKKEIPYRASTGPDDPAPLPMPENATVALIADWGTGTPEARALLEKVAAHKPDVLIHLGDVYYSGTEGENMRYLLALVNEVLGRGPDHPVPVFNLTGNHDMYSGGDAFYAMLDQLNQPPLAPPEQLQTNSFFSLRSSGWQILGMDTGLHDSDVFDVATDLTYLEDSELAWHKHQIATAGGRRTILLSHHQLFSAFSPIGPQDNGDRSLNPRLYGQFQDVLGEVEAWLWGHEHNLEIYAPYAGLKRGRCIGHSAVPVFVTQQPYKSCVGDKIPLLPANPAVPGVPVMLGTTGGVYNHGYVILKLDDASKTATVSYYQDTDTGDLLFEEKLGV
ncbi:MAG TPA: metallophosphoesterase [Thermoanaerobaculia bacterium]|nr:metallophosphoesterase [Thermoanaerobaculia bacterium]